MVICFSVIEVCHTLAQLEKDSKIISIEYKWYAGMSELREALSSTLFFQALNFGAFMVSKSTAMSHNIDGLCKELYEAC